MADESASTTSPDQTQNDWSKFPLVADASAPGPSPAPAVSTQSATPPPAEASVADKWSDFPLVGDRGALSVFGREAGQAAVSGTGEAMKGLGVVGTTPGVPRTALDLALFGPLGMPLAPLADRFLFGKQGTPAQETPIYQAGKTVKQFGEKTFPVGEEERKAHPVASFLGSATGSVGPVIAAGMADPVAGLVLGASEFGLSGAGETYDAAKAKGADEKTARDAAELSGGLNAALGILPVSDVLKPFMKYVPEAAPWAMRKLAQVAENGITFGTVGEAQNFLGQQIAKLYDPQAEYSFDANRLLGELLFGGAAGAIHPTPKRSIAGEQPQGGAGADQSGLWLGTGHVALGGDEGTVSAQRPTTAALTQWFGNSKVVDPEGNPLVVYHGTKSELAGGKFDIRKAGTSDPGLVGRAIYFTPTPEQAGEFATSPHYGRGEAPNVIPAYVKLENPAIIQDGKLPDGRTLTQAHPNGITPASSAALQRSLKAAGYDGAIFKIGDEISQVAAFSPDQIRSVFSPELAQRPTRVQGFKGLYPYDWNTGPVLNGRGQIISETPLRELTEINNPNRPYAGFFSSKPEVANRFADALSGGAGMRAAITFENPLIIDARGKPAAAFQFESVAREHQALPDYRAFQSVWDSPEHDGVILKNTKDEGDVYVPRNPQQIVPQFGEMAEVKAQRPIVGAPSAEQKADLERFSTELKGRHGLSHLGLYLTHAGDLDLSMIEVPLGARKQGKGSAAIQDIVDYADANGRRVTLTPALKDERHGTTSRSRLVQFYKRFGFVENKGRNKDFSISAGMYRDPQRVLAQRPTLAPTFYSAVERAVTSAKQEKASPEQWLATIRNTPGVKAEELEWLGLEDWLKEQKGPVTKQQVADYIRANKIDVQEVTRGLGPEPTTEQVEAVLDWVRANHPSEVEGARQAIIDVKNGQARSLGEIEGLGVPDDLLEPLRQYAGGDAGGPKFGQYTLPGGSHYRELLLTLPRGEGGAQRAAGARVAVMARQLREKYGENYLYGGQITPEESAAYERVYQEAAAEAKQFTGSHWDEPNVLAHVRFDDRVIDGKRTLHIAEIQSDFGQQYRKAKEQISSAVDRDFDTIAAKMIEAGIIKKECD